MYDIDKKELEPYHRTLEAFFASNDFYEGLVSSTRASWGGSGYSVELFEDGHFRVLWNNEIGNLYHSPGIILGLPPLDDDDLSEFLEAREQEDVRDGKTFDQKYWEEEYFHLTIENDRQEIKRELVEQLESPF